MDFTSQIPLVTTGEACLHEEYAALTDMSKTLSDLTSEVDTCKTDQCRLGNKGQKREQERSLNSLPIAQCGVHLPSLNPAGGSKCLSLSSNNEHPLTRRSPVQHRMPDDSVWVGRSEVFQVS